MFHRPLARSAGGFCLLLSCAASAQTYDYRAARLRDRPSFQSPQSTAVELRLGPYVPRVDDEFNGPTPFEDVFGNKKRLYVGLEVDWQALRIPLFGTFGPGIGIGYTKFNGRGFLQSDPTVRADQESSLRVIPMYAVGVLRFDVLARETPVPLVPYAKLGVGYALWSASDGLDLARDDAGIAGRGTSVGWQYALGLMLLLDPFDTSAAREMDHNLNVNNSYLFIEWFNSDLGGFDSTDMNVGTNTWVAGLAWEI